MCPLPASSPAGPQASRNLPSSSAVCSVPGTCGILLVTRNLTRVPGSLSSSLWTRTPTFSGTMCLTHRCVYSAWKTWFQPTSLWTQSPSLAHVTAGHTKSGGFGPVPLASIVAAGNWRVCGRRPCRDDVSYTHSKSETRTTQSGRGTRAHRPRSPARNRDDARSQQLPRAPAGGSPHLPAPTSRHAPLGMISTYRLRMFLRFISVLSQLTFYFSLIFI